MTAIPTPPAIGLTLSEIPRAGAESMRLLTGLSGLIRKHRGGDGHPVLVLPGYGAADGSTSILRFFLKRIGYTPFALALGRNVEGVDDRIQSVDDATRFRERMVELAVARVRDIHEQTGETVSLVGWSMGGLRLATVAGHHPSSHYPRLTLRRPAGHQPVYSDAAP